MVGVDNPAIWKTIGQSGPTICAILPNNLANPASSEQVSSAPQSLMISKLSLPPMTLLACLSIVSPIILSQKLDSCHPRNKCYTLIMIIPLCIKVYQRYIDVPSFELQDHFQDNMVDTYYLSTI